ncbi:MAG: hypothetical protein K6G88_02555, partial [Lachnospiraceae bacterium]|nr:hypothetical protein [Lachnospiraceae bacterium]
MGKTINLLSGEVLLDKVGADINGGGGKMYLTNKRVIHISQLNKVRCNVFIDTITNLEYKKVGPYGTIIITVNNGIK